MESIKKKREELKLEEERLQEEMSVKALSSAKQQVSLRTVEYVPFLKKFFEEEIETVCVATQTSLQFTMGNNLQGGRHDEIDFFEITLKSSPWKIVGHYKHHYYVSYLFMKK